MNKVILGITFLSIIVLIGGVMLMSINSPSNLPARAQCVTHGSSVSMHIHPRLEIIINGSQFPIPTNVGISTSCMMALHTHDETGTIHVEYPTNHNFTLGDFFSNWGKDFSQSQIFENKVDEKHTLSMSVDDQPNTDYQNLSLKDDQKIVIKYEEKKN